MLLTSPLGIHTHSICGLLEGTFSLPLLLENSHLKSKCSVQGSTNTNIGQTLSDLDQAEGTLSGPFDSGSFLGKMHLFFPSFFNKLSSNELGYLKSNERWVLDIFRDFWDLLMKKFDKFGCSS
jgi:hypothetical protein